MDTKYTIKNFRVFDEKGVSISLKPLTLLTGCNSSGKSSLVKSLLLISDYFAEIKSDVNNGKRIDLTAHKLDFTKYPHSLLGKFSKTVNNMSESQTVTFGLQSHSDMLCQDVYVELVFAAGDDDSTNGYIHSFTVKKLDGTTIYQSDVENDSTANLCAVFDEFVRFAYTQQRIAEVESAGAARSVGDRNAMSDVKFKKLDEELALYKSEFEDKCGRNAWLNINRRYNKFKTSNNRYGKFISGVGQDLSKIERVKEYGILYYIPFIGKVLNGEKEDVCSILEECKPNREECKSNEIVDEATAIILDKIIKDFKESSFDSFIDYYKNREKKYLSNFKMREPMPSGENNECPNVPDVQFIGIGRSVSTIDFHPFMDMGALDEDGKTKRERIAKWEARPLAFEEIFGALCMLSEKYLPNERGFFSSPKDNPWENDYSSITEGFFLGFVEEAIKEAVINAMPGTLEYVSSSIINVKRLYPLESSDEFTQILKRYIEAKRNIDKKLNYVPNTFLNKWVKAFDIGEKISVNVDSEGLGVTLRLHKNDSDTIGSLLADNGYGITQLFALLLNIEVCIMERNVYEKVADDSYGRHNVKFVKVISSPTVAIEEPEIHLHPRYQSMLAEMFYDAYKNYGIHFLVETHSEYLIRKSQLIVKEKKYQTNKEVEEKCPFATYYVPQSGIPYSLGYRKDGKFMKSFDSGFYDEASNLAIEIL